MQTLRIFTAWTVITISYIVLHLMIFRDSTIYDSLVLIGLLNLLAPVVCPFLILCFLAPKYTDDQSLLRGSFFDGVSLSKKRAPKYRIFKSSKLSSGAIFFPRIFSEHFVVISQDFDLKKKKDILLSEKVFEESYLYYLAFYYFFPMLICFAFIAFCLEQLNYFFGNRLRLFVYIRELTDFISTPYFYLLDGKMNYQINNADSKEMSLIRFFSQGYRFNRIDLRPGTSN